MSDRKPNIVFFFWDNFGWGELGCYGGGVSTSGGTGRRWTGRCDHGRRGASPSQPNGPAHPGGGRHMRRCRRGRPPVGFRVHSTAGAGERSGSQEPRNDAKCPRRRRRATTARRLRRLTSMGPHYRVGRGGGSGRTGTALLQCATCGSAGQAARGRLLFVQSGRVPGASRDLAFRRARTSPDDQRPASGGPLGVEAVPIPRTTE